MGDVLEFRLLRLPCSGQTRRRFYPPPTPVPDAGVPYVVSAQPGSLVLIAADTEWHLSPQQGRALAAELLRLAEYAEEKP